MKRRGGGKRDKYAERGRTIGKETTYPERKEMCVLLTGFMPKPMRGEKLQEAVITPYLK